MRRFGQAPFLMWLVIASCHHGAMSSHAKGDAASSIEVAAPAPEVQQPTYRESSEHFVQIAAGFSETCGVRNDGSILCWGLYGQCRDVAEECPLEREFVAKPANGPWKFVSVDQGYMCALRDDSSIDCWGLPKTTPHIDGTFSVLSDSYAVRTEDGGLVAVNRTVPGPPPAASSPLAAARTIAASGPMAVSNAGVRQGQTGSRISRPTGLSRSLPSPTTWPVRFAPTVRFCAGAGA